MRRPLLLAALVIVPLLAVVGAAIVGSSGDDEAAGTTTTVPGTPDGDGGGVGEATTAPAEGASTAPAGESTDPASTDEGTSESGSGPETTAPAATDEIPSPPGVAGVEGDRTVTTYPQPTVPDGGCPSRSGTVVITLDGRPSPGCVSVGADQTIEFANRTGGEISLMAEGINEVVPAGSSFSVGAAAFPDGYSTFWAPGHPDLSGLVQRRSA